MIIEALKAFLIGIVEGITEWLPISSTGHMILVDEFVKLNVSAEFLELFLVVIQLGAIMAVLILYFHKLNPFSPKKTSAEKRGTWRLWGMVAIGCIPDTEPLSLGMIGMHGSKASNMACDGCDLLIAVGCRFSDRVALKPATFARQAKIVQIDIDRAEINKNVETDHHIIGNAKQVLELLNRKVPQYDHSEWKQYVFSFPTETAYEEDAAHLTPKQILNTIARLCPDDSIVATDVGQHQMWAIQHFRFDYPGQLLTSGGFGAMGFGLGAAIGAKLGNPEKTVIHITGDGSFRMNCNELSTEEFYKAPIITFIFNNHRLGMVRQWQELIYDCRYSQTITERGPDFVKLANANGLKGARVNTLEELEAAIQEALAEQEKGLGYVVDCNIEEKELVRPMVNGGTHITEFLVN